MERKKSFYDTYRERVKEAAKTLPKAPTEIPQNILWLKSNAIERIEEIDKLIDGDICTFRTQKGREISLSDAMKTDKPYKFGFTESYVNLLMWYAYEAGKKFNEDGFKNATAEMDKTLKSIADLIFDAGYIDEH